jgi:hypothetical protein
MDNEGMDLDIIINPKTTDDGQAVIQVCIPCRSDGDALLTEWYLAGDSCWCRHQAFQARTRDQRPTKPVLTREELLRLAVDQERHLLSLAWPTGHQREPTFPDHPCYQVG